MATTQALKVPEPKNLGFSSCGRRYKTADNSGNGLGAPTKYTTVHAYMPTQCPGG